MEDARVDTDTKLTDQQLGKIKAELLLGDLEEQVARVKSYMDQYPGVPPIPEDLDSVRLIYTKLLVSLDHRLRQEDKQRLETIPEKAIGQAIGLMNALKTRYGYSPDRIRVMLI